MSDPSLPEEPKVRPKGKAPHLVLGHSMVWFLNVALALTTVVVLIVGATVFYIKSNPVTAPEWAQRKIEARLAEVLPQARISFGEMALIMDNNWRPNVRLRDVAVRSVAGDELLRFNEMTAVFAGAPLLEGQVQPGEITLHGITAQLKRRKDGGFSLQGGGSGPAPSREAATLPDLIGQVDDLLASPALSALRSVELRAVTLRYEDARADRAWTVDGGRLLLTREDEDLTITADLAVLGGGAGVATLSANYTSRIGQTAAGFGVQFDDVPAQDIAAQGPAFAWLGVLQAPISGAVRSGLTSEGQFEPIAATLQIGAGVVQPNTGTKAIPFDGARSYFSYTPEEKLLRFDELSVNSKWVTAQATGSAVLDIDPDSGGLRDLIGQIRLENVRANPADLYETPINLEAIEADFRLQLAPFRINLGRLELRDQGQTLLTKGMVRASPEGWDLALDVRMDGLAPQRLLALWPHRAAPRTRQWLSDNLLAGEVRNIDAALRLAPDMPPRTYLAFDYRKASVRYTKTLPVLTRGLGHFSLVQNRLVVTLDGGEIAPPQGGAIAVAGSSFIIPDITAKEGTPAVVRLAGQGSILSTLSLLNMPPLSALDKAGLPEALAEGEATATATLALTMQPGVKPQVSYHAEGELRGMRSDVLVKDRRIAADRLDVTVQSNLLTLTGAGTIDGVPFDAKFDQPLGPGAGAGRLRGKVALSEAALKTFGVTLPEGSVSGRGSADIDFTLARGQSPAFTLTSDLRGLRVGVPQVSWSKAASKAGKLTVAGRLGDAMRIDRLEVSGPGLSAVGNITFKADKSLDRVRFDQLVVGNWLNVPLDLIGQGAGKTVKVALRGGTLDLRRADVGSSPPTEGAPPMEVVLDRLQITDTIALTSMRGVFDVNKGLDGAFSGQVNGAAAVQGRVLPQQNRSAVRVQSANAGNVLRAADLLKQVVGGEMSLVLLPVGSGGAFDGRLTITGVTIRDAPGIAALLNAVSVVGLVNELNGDGIYFNDVEASFRLTPNQLTLTEGSAVGASMGISMDGTYLLETGRLAMQGVVSPVYLLNGIGSLFTRKGEGVIGFNYALSGLARDPQVSVNPLSALTPAMFRNIFRSPPPELPAVEGITESTLPTPRINSRRPVARTPEGR